MGTDVIDLCDKLDQADARIMDLEKENSMRRREELQRAVQDMENRDSINLCFVGIKECAENGQPRELVRAIVLNALGVNLSEYGCTVPWVRYQMRCNYQGQSSYVFIIIWRRRGCSWPPDNIFETREEFCGMTVRPLPFPI